ncbi:MAG: MoaD/ThiS family protein [Dehalococcoidia bacterium]|nr:MoaD/ThiS family protein [Dehalococcoidia bacterium]
MSVKIRLHPGLRGCTDGRQEVEAVGRTVGECINDLENRFPGIKKQLCDERGKLFKKYDIHVNGRSSYPEELAKPVKDGDELTVITFIAEG